MEMIIARSGLSTGAVYGYFKGKDDIISAVVTDGTAAMGRQLAPILKNPEPPPLPEFIGDMLHAIADFGQDRRDGIDRLLAALHGWSHSQSNPELKAATRTAYRGQRELFADTVRRWQAAGTVDPGADPERLATGEPAGGLQPQFGFEAEPVPREESVCQPVTGCTGAGSGWLRPAGRGGGQMHDSSLPARLTRSWRALARRRWRRMLSQSGPAAGPRRGGERGRAALPGCPPQRRTDIGERSSPAGPGYGAPAKPILSRICTCISTCS